jgi:DNA repair exonuclease SbcCD nuclease subunit
MNFCFVSDPHITSRIPRGRLGNPIDDAKDKLHQLFQFADGHGADVCFAGDLFDTPRDIVALFAFLEVVREYEVINPIDQQIKIYAVYGQHDMYFRNRNVVTNLGLLEKAEVITILDPDGHNDGNHRLFGCSWNEDLPDDIHGGLFKILVIHAPIYKEALYPNHAYIDAKTFANEHQGFQIIHCGDIHRRFKISAKSNLMINSGPMMRLTTDEYMMKHKPGFYYFDSQRNSMEFIKFKCKPAEEVLNKQVITDEKEKFLKNVFMEMENDFSIVQIIENLILKHADPETLRETLNELMGTET